MRGCRGAVVGETKCERSLGGTEGKLTKGPSPDLDIGINTRVIFTSMFSNRPFVIRNC